jgi:hypothetical protein
MWQERAALRDFKPDYVGLGSFASLTRFSHVRSYPNSERFAGIPKVSRSLRRRAQ